MLLCPLVASRIKLVRTSALVSHGSAQVGATPNAAAGCIAIVGPESVAFVARKVQQVSAVRCNSPAEGPRVHDNSIAFDALAR